MSQTLHRAILDALADAPGYRAKGILTTPVLEAQTHLAADETLLYQAAYTIFSGLPERLLAGSVLHIATHDVPGGVQLLWEGREPMPSDVEKGSLADVMRLGPHGDLLGIAFAALERFCQARAGFVDTVVEPIPSSSAFSRPPHVLRRVTAFLPSPGRPDQIQTQVTENISFESSRSSS